MRVSCASVAEFIENLEATDPKDVFGRVVYWSVNRQPVDGDKRTAFRYQVMVQASAVVNVPDAASPGGQYLLEAGENCGRDLEAAGGDRAGSDRAMSLQAALTKFCVDRGLTVRPGVCSE